jgi:hypothetical protein
MTHGIFGGSKDLPPVKELARKTRAIMNPVPPKERQIMDDKTQRVAFVAGAATGSAVVATILTTKIASKILDAVVDVATKKRAKSKPVA